MSRSKDSKVQGDPLAHKHGMTQDQNMTDRANELQKQGQKTNMTPENSRISSGVPTGDEEE